MLRRLKLAYSVYNFFHKKELEHNIEPYKKYGVNKKYFSSVCSEDFRNIDTRGVSTHRDTHSLASINLFNTLDASVQESISRFDELGYCVIPQYLTSDEVDSVNSDIDKLLSGGEINYKYRNKLMFAFHKSEIIKNISTDKNLGGLLNYLIDGNAKLFQSINFLSGSEQETHSDSIHMTTFPSGGLLGVWIALEDIMEDNGPIHYYPESHKLPYYMNRDFDNVGTKYLLGDKGYVAYEKMMAQKVREHNIGKQVFKASKGDMFIWHANLLHGGEPHRDKTKTRKSMVLHYFDTNRICYHEITQRPALFRK